MVSRYDWCDALLRDSRIGAATFGVACALTHNGDYETGRNFRPSVQGVGKALFAQPNTAQTHVKRLRELGYLTPAGTGQGGTVNYTLTLSTHVPEQTPAPEPKPAAKAEPVEAPKAPTEPKPAPAPLESPELPAGVSVAYSDADKAAVALSHGLVWDEAAGDWQPLPDTVRCIACGTRGCTEHRVLTGDERPFWVRDDAIAVEMPDGGIRQYARTPEQPAPTVFSDTPEPDRWGSYDEPPF